LYDELMQVLGATGRRFEVIVIDDGSTDDSFAQLAALQAGDPRLRVIRFRKNFGQTAAFAAGFAHARGRLVVTSDGDLQNDPRDIEAMVQMADRDDVDIVAGWRKRRQDTFVNRRLPSIIANWIISKSTGVALHDYGCSLKVFRAEVVKSMRLYGEMHRFLPAIASEQGVRIAEVAVNHRARTAGTTKYGISRTVRVVLDLVTVKFLLSYSTRPLQIFGLFGLLSGGLGALITAYLGWVRLVEHQSIADRPLLLLGVLLVFTGVQLVTFGLLAELMARTYYESQGKPTYVIREIRES
jgi:glycosyltransferase involved in cell wall biosynthesis